MSCWKIVTSLPFFNLQPIWCNSEAFWSMVDKVIDGNGHKKYPQLFNFVKYVVLLSHAHSVPGRGFLINKLLLELHNYTLEGTTVESLRQVQDEILCVGGIMKFKISLKLVTEVKNAHAKSKADLAVKEKMKDKENNCKNKQLQIQLLGQRVKISWMKLN